MENLVLVYPSFNRANKNVFDSRTTKDVIKTVLFHPSAAFLHLFLYKSPLSLVMFLRIVAEMTTGCKTMLALIFRNMKTRPA